MKMIPLIILLCIILGIAFAVIWNQINSTTTTTVTPPPISPSGSSTPTGGGTPQDALTQFGTLSTQILARGNSIPTGEECEMLRSLTITMRGNTTLDSQRVFAAITLYQTMCE